MKPKKNTQIVREADWRIRVFDSLSFPTLVLRPDRTIVAANQIFLENADVREDQVIGKTCKEIFDCYVYELPLPCDDGSCPLANVMKDRRGKTILKKIKQLEGDETWEDRVFSPILDDNGDIKYVMESVRDVTQVKNLEREFYGIREYMNRIVQSSPSAIVSADIQGRILSMNPAAEELFGCKLEKTRKMSVSSLYPGNQAQEIMKKLRDETQGGKGKIPMAAARIITCNGEEVPVEMTAAIIYDGDRETGTMAIFHDMREKLRIERQLEEAQTQVIQSEKMASLGRLAAGVAHEINNPLTGILLYASMMLEKLEPSDPLRRNLEYILEDTGRCQDIVKNLLAYSRQAKPRRETVAVNRLVQESLELIRDQKLFVNVRIRKHFTEQPCHLHADKNQLHQALINLVMNAVDAMAGKGTITFKTYPAPETGKVNIEITDTGAGICADHVCKVFDPFFTTKNPGKGTGLGLSTVYGIVKRNHGRISIKKSSPAGTTFLLEFPSIDPGRHADIESIG